MRGTLPQKHRRLRRRRTTRPSFLVLSRKSSLESAELATTQERRAVNFHRVSPSQDKFILNLPPLTPQTHSPPLLLSVIKEVEFRVCRISDERGETSREFSLSPPFQDKFKTARQIACAPFLNLLFFFDRAFTSCNKTISQENRPGRFNSRLGFFFREKRVFGTHIKTAGHPAARPLNFTVVFGPALVPTAT